MMNKAQKETLSKFAKTSEPVPLQDYTKAHHITKRDLKRAEKMGIATVTYGHIFVTGEYAPRKRQIKPTDKMMQVIRQVQNGSEYSNEIADSIGSTPEKVRNILYRAFKAGLLQRQENKRRGGIRYFV
jgi:uncharacterized membrane protein YgaE (UPF0421/DUF939 family)